jgi:hypothetical protein
MKEPRRHPRWVALAGIVAILLALAVPTLASGSRAGASAALPPPNSCAAPILPCYIVLSIDSGSHGNKQTVTGYRFWPGEPFTVYFWNGVTSAPAADVAYGTTDAAGGFVVSFPVPKDPVGSYTIFVADLAGDNQSAPFQLTHLTARPASGPVGNTTSVNGQGFLPEHVVKFHLHGALAGTTGRCTTNRYGNFSGCVVTIPNVSAGATHLTATDGTYTARLEFVVS